MEQFNPIKVAISQFYGIEINDFAVTVAKTALWIAESQMMKETEEILHLNLDFLPLKSYTNIIEGNALRIDWNDVVPKEELNYIMGNPPFVGARLMNKEQKNDLLLLFKNESGAGNLDYVSSWYMKATTYISNTNIKCAFVSTNSISQGEQANIPYLFTEIRQPKSNYLAIPKTSSFMRKYIPIGFLNQNIIIGSEMRIIPSATIYDFGIIESNVHMAWVKTICGRMKSDFIYSAGIVYNNFPWINSTEEQKRKIEKTAQGILDARNLYTNKSLADLYDDLTMPPELRKAHQENDKAVMEAYGFNWRTMTESDCVAELMKMYKDITSKKS